MTQEQKSILLKDLCARLPYGVICQAEYEREDEIERKYYMQQVKDKLFSIATNDTVIVSSQLCSLETCKPYLRPMSSMTEEEKHKLLKFGAVTCLENGEVVDVSCIGFERHADIQDYLNACHLDYRGLIPKGLALEAPEDMYQAN